MTSLAVICLDWKLQCVEEDGEGGLEWATPNCKIQIWILCSTEITVVWAHVMKLFCLFGCVSFLRCCSLVPNSSRFEMRMNETLLHFSNVRVRILEGGCVLNLDGSKMCMYVSVCGDFTSHAMGRSSTWGWDRQQVSTCPNIYWQIHLMCLSEQSLRPEIGSSCLLLTREVFLRK